MIASLENLSNYIPIDEYNKFVNFIKQLDIKECYGCKNIEIIDIQKKISAKDLNGSDKIKIKKALKNLENHYFLYGFYKVDLEDSILLFKVYKINNIATKLIGLILENNYENKLKLLALKRNYLEYYESRMIYGKPIPS